MVRGAVKPDGIWNGEIEDAFGGSARPDEILPKAFALAG